MTRVVSVVTPVHGPSVRYLREAYESLASQEMPGDWTWQWVVQEDGERDILNGVLPDDHRVSLGKGRRGGPGTARTLALSRVAGEVVKVFDADDLLAPGALGRDIMALTDNKSVGWTTSRVLDLLPDGSTVGFEGDPDQGVLPRGTVLDYWKAHSFRASVHPATLCIRADLLFALGGWMALPASEDTGLLLAADAVSPGYFTPECGLYYRKWSGQVTQLAAHADASEQAARFRIIQARAEALASTWHGRQP
jgi:glycosyltransferase involved in cell wall biosynthesis